MKKQELLDLQSKRDGLRAELKFETKHGKFDDAKFQKLKKLDTLFLAECREANLELTKAGRLL